jgi:adenine-specific DNA-methyltransferase
VKYELFLGDALDFMRGMKPESIDCAIIDPPYYNVVKAGWDNQWATLDDYLQWIDTLAVEWRRLLKPNGSLYVFGDDKTAAYVQVTLDKRFLLLNNIVWYKTNNQPVKNAQNFRSYAPMTERILFYSAQYDPTGWETVKLDMNNFMELREYFRLYQDAIGLNIKQINSALGHRRAEHAFYWGSTQWDLPTPEVYEQIRALPLAKPFVRRDYEALRRTFNADTKTFDVISGPIVSQSENTDHPTTKPLWLLKRLVAVSTNPGDSVLDCTMGSGTGGVASVTLGRNFYGSDIDAGYFSIAKDRISKAAAQPGLFDTAAQQ